MTAVRCVDICKTYRQGDQDIKALDHLSLEIAEGDFVCLSSPSGGGKTTLLNAIGGLDIPDSGEVWIDGERIDNLNKGKLAALRLAKIGFVFQAYNLIPVLTARENVEFVMEEQPSGSISATLGYAQGWGLTLGAPLFYLPWPSRILIEVLEPMRFEHSGPEGAADADNVRQCAAVVESFMQNAMTRLERERRG